MRWQHDSAAIRRDQQLARTRRLTAWVAGGATTASVALAAALGIALPGHTASAAAHPAGQTGTAGQSGTPTGSGTGTGHHQARHHRKLAPPRKPPTHTNAPPVVSSGGS